MCRVQGLAKAKLWGQGVVVYLQPPNFLSRALTKMLQVLVQRLRAVCHWQVFCYCFREQLECSTHVSKFAVEMTRLSSFQNEGYLLMADACGSVSPWDPSAHCVSCLDPELKFIRRANWVGGRRCGDQRCRGDAQSHQLARGMSRDKSCHEEPTGNVITTYVLCLVEACEMEGSRRRCLMGQGSRAPGVGFFLGVPNIAFCQGLP